MNNVYEIKRATENDYDMIEAFLLEVPAIDEVEEHILKNASILFLDNSLYGIISYEAFNNYALIRYFVFKRNVDELVIKELFCAVEETVRLNNVEFIFSLVNQVDIYDLFTSLGFKEVNKEDVYIEEVNFEKSKFKDTKLMLKKI